MWYHQLEKLVIAHYTYIHIYISSAFMDSKIYLMKVNRIWHLEAGGVIYSITVQAHNVILFSLGFSARMSCPDASVNSLPRCSICLVFWRLASTWTGKQWRGISVYFKCKLFNVSWERTLKNIQGIFFGKHSSIGMISSQGEILR